MQCTRPVTLDAGQTEAMHVWPQGQGAISCRFLSLLAAQGTGCNGAQEYLLRDLVWRKSRLQQAPGFCRRHQVLKILLPHEVTWVVGLRCFCVWAIAII